MKNKGVICTIGFWVLMVATLVIFLPQPVQSEEYPSRALCIVVAYGPGGRSDVTFRVFAEHMRKYTRQPVVILNKPGSGGTLGMLYAAQAKPDGYNLLGMGTTIVTLQRMLKAPVNYKDFIALGQVSNEPVIVVVNKSLPVNNIKEFVAYAKQNPDGFINANSPGGSDDMQTKALCATAGITMRQLPCKDGGTRVTALMGGSANCMFDLPSVLEPALKAGTSRIIGIATEKRHPDYPDVHTWKEDGVNLTFGGWQGLFIQKNAPPDIVAKLVEIVEKTSKDPECVKAMKLAKMYPEYFDPQATLRTMEKEDETIQKYLIVP